MLILSRKLDQEVVLITSDGPIRVVVTKIGGLYDGKATKTVKLGIKAPQNVEVLRREICPDGLLEVRQTDSGGLG